MIQLIRGTRLGSVSCETPDTVRGVAVQTCEYRCDRGHQMRLTFAADAQVPGTWTCTFDGSEAALSTPGVTPAEPETALVGGPGFGRGRPGRTHWQMLRERRSIDDLEDLLTERLALLRSGSAARH